VECVDRPLWGGQATLWPVLCLRATARIPIIRRGGRETEPDNGTALNPACYAASSSPQAALMHSMSSAAYRRPSPVGVRTFHSVGHLPGR
jgi:hypothetical protein